MALCRHCRVSIQTRSLLAGTRAASSAAWGYARRLPNRPAPEYEGHVPLTLPERLLTLAGAGLTSLVNPGRGDLVAVTTEVTAQPFFLSRLRDRMLADATGRRILRERPRITSDSLQLSYLRSLPEKSVGRVYAAWLDAEGVTPDTRLQTRYIDGTFARPPLMFNSAGGKGSFKGNTTSSSLPVDKVAQLRAKHSSDASAAEPKGDAAELAYVMQRYRECHDFYHAVTGLPIVVEGEVALKWFEFANMGMPVALLSGAGGMLPLRWHASIAPLLDASDKTARKAARRAQALRRLRQVYIPWALREGAKAKCLLNVYWEHELETDCDALRHRLGFQKPPDLRKKKEWWHDN